MTRLEGCFYFPHPDYPQHLEKELRLLAGDRVEQLYGAFYISGPPVSSCWAQNIWLEPTLVTFQSLSDAASQLRQLGKLWSPAPDSYFRKTALIQEKLPHLSTKPRAFPFSLPQGAMGSWKLIEETTLLASPRCSSPFPGGKIDFEENKIDPPSSAYLKLWEALTLYGKRPQAGEICLDAGSCPGGWTWVLSQTEAQVISIDRAPLDNRLIAQKNVQFQIGNAFALKPEDFAHIDWFCSDVICTPEKLYRWLLPWIESKKVSHFIVTVKMKGEPDWQTMDLFKAIPGSRLVHLFHNKNELTWML